MIKTVLVTLAMIALTAFTVNAQETEYLDFNLSTYEGVAEHNTDGTSAATNKKISVYLFTEDVSFCVPDVSYKRNWSVLANHHNLIQTPRVWKHPHPVKGPTFFTAMVDKFGTEWLLGAVPSTNEVCIMGFAIPVSTKA